jgi:predicted RND superfamily exporter protein
MKKYLEWVVRHNRWVLGICVLVTLFLGFQIKNLTIELDPDKNLPQDHPFIIASNTVKRVFGSNFVLTVGITAKQGDIYQKEVADKILSLTRDLGRIEGINSSSSIGLASKKAKDIRGTDVGLSVKRMIDPKLDYSLPQNQNLLREAVYKNPIYATVLVSKDSKTTSINLEMNAETKRFDPIVSKIETILQKYESQNVEFHLGGLPYFLSWLERYSTRMGLFFSMAIVIIGILHYEAFRTHQGLILPLITALFAVIWGLGLISLTGIPLDVFNATTPILILAVAAGHAVQILKRYYEEFGRLKRESKLSDIEINQRAVVESLNKVGPVMIVACTVACLGFLSLLFFRITTIRTFGIFSALGILSALLIEMTLIPSLRSMLSPPKSEEIHKESSKRIWDKIINTISNIVTGANRKLVYGIAFVLLLIGFLGSRAVIVENRAEGTIAKDRPAIVQDSFLNQTLAGTNTMNLLIEGNEDSIKDPNVLMFMRDLQTLVESNKEVGKSISIVDLVMKLNQAMNGDRLDYFAIPKDRDLISQYLLLYSISGDPGDFDSYVNYDYSKANITIFMKTDSSKETQILVDQIQSYVKQFAPTSIKVSIGGSNATSAALNEVMVEGKVLNIIQILSVVVVVTSLVFRSPIAGLLAVIPLLFSLALNFGTMGIFGVPLNITTSLISALVVGVGADFSIYLLFRIREEMRKSNEDARAIREALKSAGKAVLFVATALAGGYSILIFSFGFYTHIYLGIFIPLAMITSSFSALIVLTSLVYDIKPKFIYSYSKNRI